MPKPPRHHHYVPQFYLAGFTTTGSSDGRLYVLDIEKGSQWSRTPAGAAHKRDYHTVDLGSGQDPMVFESTLAKCEGKWAAVLQSVLASKVVPQGDSFADLVAFVAFMAVRVPRFRRQVAAFVDRASKATLRSNFSMADSRQHIRYVIDQYLETLSPSERRRVQRFLNSGPQLDRLAAHVNSEGYRISYDQTWTVQTMVQAAITLIPVIGRREWALRTVAHDAPDLTCSDNPVCLSWVVPVRGAHSPGFGVKNTLLTIPLGKRLLLASTFEEMFQTTPLTSVDVSTMNRRTAMFASQIYSPGKDFAWLMDDGRIGDTEAFVNSRIKR